MCKNITPNIPLFLQIQKKILFSLQFHKSHNFQRISKFHLFSTVFYSILEMTEANKQWQLNLYELHRKPLQIPPPRPDGENTVTMKTAVLTDLLTCPICLDVLENTMVTKNCLHRFCSECITTALRRGNQECPTCRKKLVSRRCLRPDPNFDSLITKLFPDRKDAGDKEETDLMNLVKQHSVRLHKTATERGVLIGDSSDADGPVVKAKGRGRKRKSTARESNIEKIDEVDSDGMTGGMAGGIESPRDTEVKAKRSGKRTNSKKKVKDSDEEADEPTPEPLKKRKRKTKKSQNPQIMTPQNRTPNISAQNSLRNSDNDSDTDNDSTISKLSKISKLDSKLDSKPTTPRSRKKDKTIHALIDFTPPASEKPSLLQFSSPEVSEAESTVNSDDSHSETSHKSSDFHFTLSKIDEDNDVVATEQLATSSESTIQHVREFILEKLVRINVRKYTVLVGVLRESSVGNELRDSDADASVGKVYENEFGSGEACVFGYKVVRV